MEERSKCSHRASGMQRTDGRSGRGLRQESQEDRAESGEAGQINVISSDRVGVVQSISVGLIIRTRIRIHRLLVRISSSVFTYIMYSTT